MDVLGPVSEAAKWELLRRGTALVSPSRWEAFSLVVVEAWSARTPVMVNAACGPTTEHCLRSGGGVPYDGYGEFEVAVERLVRRPRPGRDPRGAGPGLRGRAVPLAGGHHRYAAFLESVATAGRRSVTA